MIHCLKKQNSILYTLYKAGVFLLILYIGISFIVRHNNAPFVFSVAHAEDGGGDGGPGGGGDGGPGGGGDGGPGGGGDGGPGGGGDGGPGGGGDGGPGGGGDAGVGVGVAGGPDAPGVEAPGPAPAGAPPATPPAAPPAAPPTGGGPGPSGPGGPGGGPFLGVCLDRQATNYGGTLPCLYPAGSPITLARKITPLSFVYLSQVPYTGIGDNAASYAFLITLLGISGFLSYQYMYGKKENFLAFAGISGLKDAFTFPTKIAPVETPKKIEAPTAPQNPHSAALFIKALLERDQDVAFMLLRGVLREETSVRNFIVKAIAEIETAYRIKMGEAGAVHPTTAEAVALHTPETLEILLTHLLSAIHTPFTSHALAAQIAVVKITEALQTLPLTQEV